MNDPLARSAAPIPTLSGTPQISTIQQTFRFMLVSALPCGVVVCSPFPPTGPSLEGGTSLKQAYEQAVVGMFGYMTDLSTVERRGKCEVEAEGARSLLSLLPLWAVRKRGAIVRMITCPRVTSPGHDLESLLFNLMDEFLFFFSTELVVSKEVPLNAALFPGNSLQPLPVVPSPATGGDHRVRPGELPHTGGGARRTLRPGQAPTRHRGQGILIKCFSALYNCTWLMMSSTRRSPTAPCRSWKSLTENGAKCM